MFADSLDASLQKWTLGSCANIDSFQGKCECLKMIFFGLDTKEALTPTILLCLFASIVCQVNRADYLNGRTALHFAALNGHARCIRLLFADFFPTQSSISSDLPQATAEEGSSAKPYVNKE